MSRGRSASYQMDMCDGPILKKLLIFTIPLICSSVLQLLFNAVDVIVVGKYAGDNALAAVGSNTPLINLFVNFFMGLSIGANILVSRYYGAKQRRELRETVHTTIAISLVSGVVLAIFGVGLSPIILKWMQVPKEVLSLATVYLRVYFLGMPALMLYNFGAAILRAIGDTKRPLYFLTVAGVVNATLNLFFVIVLHWGVFGVAFATVISQAISAGCVLRCLMKAEDDIQIELKNLRIHRDKILRMLRMGVPAGLQSILFSVSNVLVQSAVNSFGATVVAGNSAAANIDGFIYVAMIAFSQANISFTSQNMGARKYNRLNRILFTTLWCVVITGLLSGIMCYVTGPILLTLYTNSSDVIAAGMVRLGYIGLFYFLLGIMEVMVGSLRGMGFAVCPTIVSLVGSCLFRIVWLQTVFRVERFHVIDTVYILFPISWIITAIAHIVTYIVVKRKFVNN